MNKTPIYAVAALVVATLGAGGYYYHTESIDGAQSDSAQSSTLQLGAGQEVELDSSQIAAIKGVGSDFYNLTTNFGFDPSYLEDSDNILPAQIEADSGVESQHWMSRNEVLRKAVEKLSSDSALRSKLPNTLTSEIDSFKGASYVSSVNKIDVRPKGVETVDSAGNKKISAVVNVEGESTVRWLQQSGNEEGWDGSYYIYSKTFPNMMSLYVTYNGQEWLVDDVKVSANNLLHSDVEMFFGFYAYPINPTESIQHGYTVIGMATKDGYVVKKQPDLPQSLDAKQS